MTTIAGRPRTVAVVAAFLFTATALALMTGTSLLFPAPFWNRLWDLNRPAYAAFEKLGSIAGMSLLAVGAGALTAGIGLLRGRKWAWWSAVALFAVNGAGDVVGFVVTRDLMKSGSGILIAGCFLFYLTRPKVKRFFGPV